MNQRGSWVKWKDFNLFLTNKELSIFHVKYLKSHRVTEDARKRIWGSWGNAAGVSFREEEMKLSLYNRRKSQVNVMCGVDKERWEIREREAGPAQREP